MADWQRRSNLVCEENIRERRKECKHHENGEKRKSTNRKTDLGPGEGEVDQLSLHSAGGNWKPGTDLPMETKEFSRESSDVTKRPATADGKGQHRRTKKKSTEQQMKESTG